MNGPIHTVKKLKKNLNVTENSKTFKCDDGKIYTIKW